MPKHIIVDEAWRGGWMADQRELLEKLLHWVYRVEPEELIPWLCADMSRTRHLNPKELGVRRHVLGHIDLTTIPRYIDADEEEEGRESLKKRDEGNSGNTL